MLGFILNNSLSLSVQYFSSQAYKSFIELLGQIERVGIGSTRAFIRDPKAMLQSMIQRSRASDNGSCVVSLGYLGGNYAVITPKSQEQLVELLNIIDSEPQARKGHASFKFFSGNDFFIISDVGHGAITLRKNLSRFLIPSRLCQPTIREISEQFVSGKSIQLRHTICGIVRTVMLGNILGINKLPEETYDLMEAYRNDVKKWGAFPFPELLNLMPSLRRKRETYRAFSNGILEFEFEALLDVLQNEAKPSDTNLIAASVISLFKDDNPALSDAEVLVAIRQLSKEEIRRYFEDPIVQSLPMLLKAADNLTDAINLCLEQIISDPVKLQMLRSEIDDAVLNLDWDSDLRELKQLPILDAFYKESVRFDAPVAVPRFTQVGVSSESIDIPPNTMIIFDLNALSKGQQYWSNPEIFDPKRFLLGEQFGSESSTITPHIPGKFPFVPFSVGKRNCPAFAVTEVLFKATVAKIISEYELNLLEELDGDKSIKVEARVPLSETPQI